MAEESKKKSDAAAAAAGAAHDKGGDKKESAKGGGGLLSKTPVLMGGVMLIEAVVLFAGFKFLGGGAPKAAAGAELVAEEAAPAGGEHSAEGGGKEGEAGNKGAGGSGAKIDRKKSVEVQVLDFRAPNKQSGRTFLYDVTISAVTKSEFKDRVEGTIKEREALIKDRVRTIIAQSDPEKLGGASEPGLETLRRQVKYQLDEIVGEGMIDEVLVPRCIPFRTDY
jgi:flagellar basal body-associated protein FliL